MKDEELEIIEDKSPGFSKFTLKGRVNAASADILQDRLDTAIFKEEQKKIVVNMSNVEYLSSIGIRVILRTYKQSAGTGGKFKIENPSENVKNVLGMVALKDLLA
jgi:anti-sigma B factor antagonist